MGTRITSSGYIADGTITHAKLAADAVEHDKIKALTIVNADISATAAIAKTKLAALDILNADINAAAEIVGSKLAQNLEIAQTVATGKGVYLNRNLASANTDSPLVQISNLNAGDDKPALYIANPGNADSIQITNGSTSYQGISINNGGTQFVLLGAGDANKVDPSSLFSRNRASADTGAAVVSIVQDNAGDDQPALHLQQDGTGAWIDFKGGLAIATGKTAADEYVQVQTTAGTRWLRLYT